MKDYSGIPEDVRDYIYDDEIVIDLNNGYYIPRVDEVIAKIKKHYNITTYQGSKTIIIIRASDFNGIDNIIDMPYTL